MKARTITGLALAPIVAAAVAACGGASSNTAGPTVPQAGAGEGARVNAIAGSCARVRAASSTVAPLANPRTGSTVALATQGGRTIAYAADEDDWGVHVVDVDAHKELGETALDGRPSQLMFLPDGRLAVLLRDKAKVAVLEPGEHPEQLDARCAVDTAAEPVSLALTPDDGTLLVSSAWGRALGAYDARSLAKSFQVALPREPRAVVVSDDGKYAFVSHAVGARATRVTLADKTVAEVPLFERDQQTIAQEQSIRVEIEAFRKRGGDTKMFDDQLKELAARAHPSCQGFALAKTVEPGGRILAPQVLVDPGDPRQRAPGYGDDNNVTEAGDVAVIDSESGKPLSASLERPNDNVGWGGVDPRDAQKPECLLPRAAAVDTTSKSLLVSCFGIDQVVAYDAFAASPARAERQRWIVGAGPSGIAVDAGHNRAVVWSQFDRALNLIDLGPGKLADTKGRPPTPADRIDMAPNANRKISTAAALGRLLFHSVGDGRIARDGRACASCHPEGRDDSLVWATPDGPRRSIMLAGRIVNTAPYAWAGNENDLKVHLAMTFDRLNGQGGLKSLELEALTAYVETLTPPPGSSGGAPAPPGDARVRRGAELFASTEVGCSDCHAGALETDNKKHDVKSKTDADKSGEFNTPTLHFVGGTGPYFHDGRYKTLHDLLTANKDEMGHTSQLSPEDIDSLEAYLRTL